MITLDEPKSISPPTLRARLEHAVEHGTHLLPGQGPIGVFIHHNTLHAFQHLPFEQAVVEASRVFGTEPFMTEDAYREQYSLRRITELDVAAVVARESNIPIIKGGLDRHALRIRLLSAGQRRFDPLTIRWQMEETDLLRLLRRDLSKEIVQRLLPAGGILERTQVNALFTICMQNQDSKKVEQPDQRRTMTAEVDDLIHPLLIRLCSAYLDQGLAYWPMSDRGRGFLVSVRSLLSQPWSLFPEHLDRLAEEFRVQSKGAWEAEDVVLDMLSRLGVDPEKFDQVVRDELLALPGWAGIMHRLEHEPELAPYQTLRCSVVEYLAVRLTLKAVATESLVRERKQETVEVEFDDHEAIALAQTAARFDAMQILGIGKRQLESLTKETLQLLVSEIDALDELERRRILHLAYEANHETGILQPLGLYRQSRKGEPAHLKPAAQIFFCIDEREESIRRHVEEIAPDVETYGAAGFFGVAMNYAGIDDAHDVALCPVVVKPKHLVTERPIDEHNTLYRIRVLRRKLHAAFTRHTWLGSRTLVRGWAGTSALGILALPQLLMRVLSPLHYGSLVRLAERRFMPEPITHLSFTRQQNEASEYSGPLLEGFTVQEKIDRVEGVLRPAGLHKDFAPLVIVLGHGSTSLNNPHESAHDCGACGGRRGGPNARLFAAMANSPQVRTGLAARGILIPSTSWFVGGSGGPAEALRHVQERAEHLSEPRPEYGHATNAVCIVGRRSLSKGLFLDRRAFLVSYDATLDPNDEGLARLLAAAVPVCAGINLEYYFSFVDNERYGSGTKLPHNVTGLMGVMNGPESDLRTEPMDSTGDDRSEDRSSACPSRRYLREV